MTLQQFLLILRARYRVALITFLVIVALTVVISLVLPKQYTASAAVVIDVKSPDPVSGIILQGMMAPGYMATQIDIIIKLYDDVVCLTIADCDDSACEGGVNNADGTINGKNSFIFSRQRREINISLNHNVFEVDLRLIANHLQQSFSRDDLLIHLQGCLRPCRHDPCNQNQSRDSEVFHLKPPSRK